MARSGEPLEPPSAGQWEVGLAWRRRRPASRVPSGGCSFSAGLLLAKVASHDAFGRADTHFDRWVAAHRTNDVNQATHSATDAAETPTIAALAVLTIAGVALAWQCWREPMLVAVATGEVLIFLTITLLLPRHG